MGKLYTDKSIESLSPLEFTRLRPQVYAGDCTYSTQLLVEIFSNAIDEYRAGHGDKIEVTVYPDNKISLRDYGQGFIPNSFRDDGKSILEAAFSVLNTSGKYREDGTYEGTSLGSFGIGSKITTFLSHWLRVKTIRDNQWEEIYFKEGVFQSRSRGAGGVTGTYVEWLPSEEFFTNVEIETKKIESLFYTVSCLCPGLTIIFDNKGDSQTFYSRNGLNDLVDKAVKDNEVIKNRLNINWSEGKYQLDLTMTYTTNYSSTIVAYVNSGLTETGPHITQLKTTLTREVNKFLREKGWLKEKDDNLTGDDIQEGMYMIFNITAPNVGYDAQVKSRVTAIETKAINATFAEHLEYWMSKNEKDIKMIADKAINAKKARDAAKKARDAVREGEKRKKEKVLKTDSKLADCYGKDRLKCEIYITEGDSASANLKQARDNATQAVLPVRGKILNCQKATLTQIQKNAEIVSMIDAFGLKIDPKTMKITYDKKDLRYGKIIIMSDADVDGSHIKNLFYTFIWNFCPQLIKDGYVYAGVPPLYKVTIGKEYKYLKNDDALEEFKNSHKGRKLIVNRLKGLGEMSVEETEETLTDPDNRIIKQITVDDAKAADILFEQLMGNGSIARKEFIKKHSQEATGAI